MKIVFIFVLTISIISSCGKNKSGTQIGQEICDCYKKAFAMVPANAIKAQALKDCRANELEILKKVKDDKKKVDEIRRVRSDCGARILNKSSRK